MRVQPRPNVGSWDVSQVRFMDSVFEGATVADPAVANWDVSNVVSMQGMFAGTTVRQSQCEQLEREPSPKHVGYVSQRNGSKS